MEQKIYYGDELDEYIDVIEKDDNGYYSRHLKNNAKSDHFKSIEDLLDFFKKTWNYVCYENNGIKTEVKNIEKELDKFGRILTEDYVNGEPYYSDAPGSDSIIIKTILYNGSVYYYKIENSFSSGLTIPIKTKITIKKLK